MVVYLVELFCRLIHWKWQIGGGGNRLGRTARLGGGHLAAGGGGAYGPSARGEGHGGMLMQIEGEMDGLKKR
jgi:hypothetical protein